MKEIEKTLNNPKCILHIAHCTLFQPLNTWNSMKGNFWIKYSEPNLKTVIMDCLECYRHFLDMLHMNLYYPDDDRANHLVAHYAMAYYSGALLAYRLSRNHASAIKIEIIRSFCEFLQATIKYPRHT